MKSKGSEHPDVGSTYEGIGLVYAKKGDYAKAIEYSKKSFDIDLNLKGAEHPDTKRTQKFIDVCKKNMMKNSSFIRRLFS